MFEIDKVPLGWKAIIDQYNRDKILIEQNKTPKVPGLRYNFVYRDVWTRLNVLPAKIMQVCALILSGLIPSVQLVMQIVQVFFLKASKVFNYSHVYFHLTVQKYASFSFIQILF